MSATRQALGETIDPGVLAGVIIGQTLCSMANEVDTILDDVKEIVDQLLTGSSEIFTQKILSFYMTMTEEIVKNGINKEVIVTIIMFAYVLIRHYLKRHINEADILLFIERMASLFYQVFAKFGILDWITKMGGWDVLKSVTRQNMLSGIKKSHWAVIASIALLITGVIAYNYYQVMRDAVIFVAIN